MASLPGLAAATGPEAVDCLDAGTGPGALLTRQFAFEGRCTEPTGNAACGYYDYRQVPGQAVRGFDQRGVTTRQITFPGLEHQWAALSIRRPAGSVFCWVGGAVVGRNPLAMNWGGPTGTKRRKNNFLLTEGGRIQVENARVHNSHDALLADGPDAGFDIRDSWITWNRDDFFEGYLQDLRISDTLIDGTYTFISDPDGDCDAAKQASERTIVIEDSLIRLQQQPGPYGGGSPKWHASVEGGHNQLWKLDSCDWQHWPVFELRNNVFLIEGPGTTAYELNAARCNLALPGDCEDRQLSKLAVCENNLFLYTGYQHWLAAGTAPGPTPRPGGRFFNPDNPDFRPDGQDCYQRVTDGPQGKSRAEVLALWHSRRAAWIERHVMDAPARRRVMQIPGVDYPVYPRDTTLRVRNAASRECLTSLADGTVRLHPCKAADPQQRFTVATFEDGKLAAALLLRDALGRYLYSSQPAAPASGEADAFAVTAESTAGRRPGFAERWYLLPLGEEASPERQRYVIESDAIGRTWLYARNAQVALQRLYPQGPDTPLPYARFRNGNDPALQWSIDTLPAGAD